MLFIVPFQEVETTEKNALTKKIDKVKYKVSKARSDLRVKVSCTDSCWRLSCLFCGRLDSRHLTERKSSRPMVLSLDRTV